MARSSVEEKVGRGKSGDVQERKSVATGTRAQPQVTRHKFQSLWLSSDPEFLLFNSSLNDNND